MKSINLLPKVPVTKEYFSLILSGIIGLTLLGGTGVTYYYVATSAEIINQAELRDELVAHKNQLMQERMTDPQTASYKALTKEVDSLKQTIRYWPPIFAEVTGTLPTASRILTMATSPEDVIKISAEMGSMEAVADYIIALQGSSLLEKVSILSLALKEMTPVVEETAALQETGSTSPYNAVTSSSSSVQTEGNSGSQTVTPEEYLDLLKKEPATNSEANETDELLGELDWMINQQMSKQLHGITIPNRTPGVTPAPAPSDSPITQEDIDKARKAMEALQKVQVTNSPKPASSPSGTGTVEPTGTQAPVTAPAKKVYAVEFELKCKPLVIKEK
jgi:Tfp pilus assembly protein PilN